MIAPRNHKQQRTSDRRGLGAALCVGGCDRSSPAAHDKAQGRTHARPVGVSRSTPTGGLTQFLPCQTGGGFGSRLFSQFTHAARGGRIGELRYAARLPAKFSAALLIGRSHQLYRIGHQPGSNWPDPLHLERLSYGFVAMTQHRTSGVVNVGKEVVGERNAE